MKSFVHPLNIIKITREQNRNVQFHKFLTLALHSDGV
jgi:hypothetical protein